MVWHTGSDWSHRELQKVWPILVPYTRGRVLEIGSGNNRTFPHWVTSDSGKDFGGQRVSDLHFTEAEMDLFKPASWDAVVSSHVLEHIEDWEAALERWFALVKPGGNLVLYLPDRRHYPMIGQPGANPDHKHDFVPDDILHGMKRIAERTGMGWVCLENEVRAAGEEYSFLQVFKRRSDGEMVFAPWQKPEKSCLVVRYGAFGDQVLASSILPALKEQGWHVTWNAAQPQVDVVRTNPYIDAFWLQDKDQVPNEKLGEYWAKLEERFDKIVNLCESLEGQLLTLPGRINDNYPDETRRRVCNINYMERTHDIANVPHDFAVKFYPTEEEKRLAANQFPPWGGKTLLWIMNGSSVHKVWPWMPPLITRLLYQHPDLRIILAGEERSQTLETAIENAAMQFFGPANRIYKTCGRWPIRGTLTLAQMVDVVVGPETGVLNAVCLEEDVQKVVFLSHSSEEMLTKHWKSTIALSAGDKAPCYPCARLHYDWSRCNMVKETGTALCQNVISIDEALEAINTALERVPPKVPSLEIAAE